jgi:hypothetical protein
MKVSEKRQRYRTMFDEAIISLDKSIVALSHSYKKCTEIANPSAEYSLDEQESFEALASRFARSSDLLTQKVLKTFFVLLQEDIKTVIDGANLLEKLVIIDNADDLLNIRAIRNQIAHDYIKNDLQEFYKEIIEFTPMLEKIADAVKAFYGLKFK